MSEYLTCIAMEIEAPRSDFMPWFQCVQRNSRDQIEWSIGRVGPDAELRRLGRMILATAFPDPRPFPKVPFPVRGDAWFNVHCLPGCYESARDTLFRHRGFLLRARFFDGQPVAELGRAAS